jgi:hypothetical protein
MTKLDPTYGQFNLRGIAVGLSHERSLSDGRKEGKDEWKRLQFGIKVNDNSVIYPELMGTKTDKVKLVHRKSKNGKYDMTDTLLVPWGEHHKQREDNYELFMPVKVNLERSSYFNDTEELTSYEAAEYIVAYLKDGDFVYVQGSLQINEYKDKSQDKYIIQNIFIDDEKIDFSAGNFKQEAFFVQEIVFLNLELEKENYRYMVETYIIHRKDGDMSYSPFTFVIDYGKYKDDNESLEESREVIKFFKNEVTYGSTIQVHGNINHYVKKVNTPEGIMLSGGAVRELEITGGNLKSLVKDRYCEEDFVSKVDPFFTGGQTEELTEENDPF